MASVARAKEWFFKKTTRDFEATLIEKCKRFDVDFSDDSLKIKPMSYFEYDFPHLSEFELIFQTPESRPQYLMVKHTPSPTGEVHFTEFYIGIWNAPDSKGDQLIELFKNGFMYPSNGKAKVATFDRARAVPLDLSQLRREEFKLVAPRNTRPAFLLHAACEKGASKPTSKRASEPTDDSSGGGSDPPGGDASGGSPGIPQKIGVVQTAKGNFRYLELNPQRSTNLCKPNTKSPSTCLSPTNAPDMNPTASITANPEQLSVATQLEIIKMLQLFGFDQSLSTQVLAQKITGHVNVHVGQRYLCGST